MQHQHLYLRQYGAEHIRHGQPQIDLYVAAYPLCKRALEAVPHRYGEGYRTEYRQHHEEERADGVYHECGGLEHQFQYFAEEVAKPRIPPHLTTKQRILFLHRMGYPALKKMKQISIEIIHKCPNRCLHCSSNSDINCTLKIETADVKKIIDSASKLNTEVLSISGGEPFLHDGLLEIVHYAKSKGIKVYIYTSGIILNIAGQVDSIQQELLQQLYSVAVDKIIFDLPAINEAIYNKFMGTSGYQKFVFESINKAQNIGICTEIHFVPTKINLDEIDGIVKFAERAGVNKVSFLGLVPHGRAANNTGELVLDTDENEKLKLKLEAINNNKIRIGIPLQREGSDCCCYAGKNKLCIRYDGKVFGCETFKYIQLADENNRIVKPDSIYNKSLEDIYYHSEYLKYERKFVEHQMALSGCGEKCPVQRKMRRVAEI